MRRVLKIIQLLCGLAVLYVAIGCLIGFALPERDPNVAGCFPYTVTFGVFLWKCTSGAADLFWSIVVGWPRFVIIPPGLVFASVKAALKNGPDYFHLYLANAVPFILPSVPVAVALWGSFVFWETRSKGFALGLTTALLAEIVYFGLLE